MAFDQKLFKPNVVLDGMKETVKQALQNSAGYSEGTATGIGNTRLVEPIPEYARAEAEKVVNKGNSWLVLGRDRPASKLSGYGGKGDTGASAIDLVAGRMGYNAQSVSTAGERLFCDPNYKVDAARIYISQKTDIDANFGIVNGAIGESTAKSGIAIKADAIRIVGRENIKLVTKTDLKNSQGGGINSTAGVDIIAGNDDSNLQPMALGDNLTECLDNLMSALHEYIGDMQGFITYQAKFNAEVMQHYHISPFFGAPTSPSEQLIPAGITCMTEQVGKSMQALTTLRLNLNNIQVTYLSEAGAKYINSKFNNVN